MPPPAPARDSQASMLSVGGGSSSGGGGSGRDSGRSTPSSIGGGSLAGGLAEALRARQSAMSGQGKKEDDDW